MSDVRTTITESGSDQEHATVKSVLAQAPDEFVQLTAPTVGEVVQFVKQINADQDRIEAKRDGATVSNYYFGRLQMQELTDHLKSEFPQTYKNKFKITENFTKSTSRQLSTIYKQSAVRDAANKRNGKLTEEQLKEQTEIIQFIYEFGNIDRSYQEIERFAKWAKSVLIKVSFQSETGKTTLKPYSPQFYDVMVSEGGILRAVIISDYLAGKVSKDSFANRRYWVWTDTQIFQLKGSNADIVSIRDNELGRIPFIFFNDDLPVENQKPYLHADLALSNANLAINRTLTDAMSLIKNKTYGQTYIIGSDADKLPKNTGHEEVWHIVQGKNDTEMPKVGVLTPEGDLDSILTMVERVANGYATTRGLAPDSFSAVKASGATSGIALKIKNHTLLEMRDSEEAKYKDLENEIFDLVRALHNFHEDAQGGHDLPALDENIKLAVHFDDNSLAFENPVELRRQQLTEVQQGLMKRTDFVRSSRPHMDVEQATVYLQAVNDENEKLGVLQTLESLDSIITNNGQSDDTAA